MKVQVVFALVGLLAVLPAAQAQVKDKKSMTPSVTVVGSGEVAAKPDMAQIQVGVTTQADTAAAALKTNNEAMESLFRTLEGRGIEKKDMQTSNFHVSPVYKPNPRGDQAPTIIGYQVTNQLSVKVRSLANLGAILDEVVSKGANQVHGISFSVAEPKPVQDEARRKAMADARRKAELYAKEAGVDLGKVIRIEEAVPHFPQPQIFGGVMGRAEAAAVPVAPGEQNYSAHITVTYAIK